MKGEIRDITLELRDIKHAVTLLQKAIASLEGRLAVDTPKKQNGFKPPTRIEAMEYHDEKRYSFDLAEWLLHYKANGWKVGKVPMKDWKACMAQWESRHKKANPTRTKVQLDAMGRPLTGGNGRLL